jgi:aldehyde dehydrogenase (NAD+)
VEAGVPAGVVNLVNGDGSTGRAIVDHPGIAKIAFTGSTEVGPSDPEAHRRQRQASSARAGRQVTVHRVADADLDAAVEGLVDSIFFNQGQVCCAGSRLLVHEGTAARLTDKLQARMARIRVGNPLDKSSDMGALVSPVQCERVAGFVDRARAEGRWCTRPAPAGCLRRAATTRRRWSPASTPPARSCSEEVFGPVLTVQTFRTPAEAVELANHTRYGLAASVWSESIGLALDLAPRLKAGVVWVNGANQFDAACGFGGCANRASAAKAGARACGNTCTARARQPRPASPHAAAPRPPVRVRARAQARARGRWRRWRRSTARPSSTSAASRCGPTAATAASWRRRRTAVAWCPRATARTSAMPSRRRAPPWRLGTPERPWPRAGAVLPGREPGRAAPRLLALLARLGDAGAAAELQASVACLFTPPPGPTSSTAPCTSRRCARWTLALHEPVG